MARVKGLPIKANLRPLKREVTDDGKENQASDLRGLKVDVEKNHSVVQLTIHEGVTTWSKDIWLGL